MKNPALELTVEQLQEALNQKLQQDKKDKELRKQAYEQIKTELVEARMKRIKILEAMIHEEHKLAMSEMEAFRDVMNEYGELPKIVREDFQSKIHKVQKE
jgi:type II secretory pathway predicted ATPase ExeA